MKKDLDDDEDAAPLRPRAPAWRKLTESCQADEDGVGELTEVLDVDGGRLVRTTLYDAHGEARCTALVVMPR